MDLLRVEGLQVRYPIHKEPSIKDVSFIMKKGELVLLTGKSGCGKSTLLKCINLTIPHFIQAEMRGVICIGDRNTASMQVQDIVSLVGIMWQDVEAQIVNLKVEDELAFGLENLGVEASEITRRLKVLEPLLNIDYTAFIHSLSGGQKQRVVMGAVLSMLPDLILLDEPLANLDYESSKSFLAFIKSLTGMGKSILMVEHRLDMAAHYCDRLLIMEKGVLVRDIDDRDAILEEERKRKFFRTLQNGNSRQESAVSINNLSFSYGHKSVLSNVSIDIKAGERVVVLGENGCGKTTLLKIISGLLPVRNSGNGMLKLFGAPVHKKRKGQEGMIGFVFQNPNHQLFMDSVYNEVCLNGFNDKFVEEIVELFELDELLSRHPLSLSQGQKRLVAVASVVASKPKILLLDEPTIGQDYDNLHRITEVLNALNQRYSMTLITVTHDQLAAKALCDRVVEIAQGGIGVGGVEMVDQYFS
jgi:energy-coupling factor transporter ATP-binding protein EcfA2